MIRIIIITLISLWVITNIIPLVNFLTEPPVLIIAIIYLSFLYLDKKKAYDNLIEEIKQRSWLIWLTML